MTTFAMIIERVFLLFNWVMNESEGCWLEMSDYLEFDWAGTLKTEEEEEIIRLLLCDYHTHHMRMDGVIKEISYKWTDRHPKKEPSRWESKVKRLFVVSSVSPFLSREMERERERRGRTIMRCSSGQITCLLSLALKLDFTEWDYPLSHLISLGYSNKSLASQLDWTGLDPLLQCNYQIDYIGKTFTFFYRSTDHFFLFHSSSLAAGGVWADRLAFTPSSMYQVCTCVV